MEVKATLRQFLRLKGWGYRAADKTNIAIKVCPFCSNEKWKFRIHHETTQYRCWVCDASGNLKTLKRHVDNNSDDPQGQVMSAASAVRIADSKKFQPIDMEYVDKWHSSLLKDEDALAYARSRGFTDAAIDHFKLGMRGPWKGKYYLAIPHIIEGVCWNVKFRTLPTYAGKKQDKTFRRIEDSASVLFNADALEKYDEVFLMEAETDAIALWSAGLHNVISLTGGAKTFLAEWYDSLVGKEKVVIVLDADDVGQTAARDIARRIGFDKCVNVFLPAHDANGLLIDQGPEALVAAVGSKHQEKFEVHGVLSAGDVLLNALHRKLTTGPGLLSPWPSVNNKIGGGLYGGDLVYLLARYKIGKTTFAMQWLDYVSEVYGPSMMYCMEMSTARLGDKIAQHTRRKPVEDLTELDYHMARYMVRKKDLYFVEPEWTGKPTPEDINNKVREAAKRHGIKFFVFDNLHFLSRSMKYTSQEIGAISKGFKSLAQELDLVAMIIVQPGKLRGKQPTADDAKWSSDIPADCDWFLTLHREEMAAGLVSNDFDDVSDQEILSNETEVTIQAARFGGGGRSRLWYQGEIATFFELDEVPSYLQD